MTNPGLGTGSVIHLLLGFTIELGGFRWRSGGSDRSDIGIRQILRAQNLAVPFLQPVILRRLDDDHALSAVLGHDDRLGKSGVLELPKILRHLLGGNGHRHRASPLEQSLAPSMPRGPRDIRSPRRIYIRASG